MSEQTLTPVTPTPGRKPILLDATQSRLYAANTLLTPEVEMMAAAALILGQAEKLRTLIDYEELGERARVALAFVAGATIDAKYNDERQLRNLTIKRYQMEFCSELADAAQKFIEAVERVGLERTILP